MTTIYTCPKCNTLVRTVHPGMMTTADVPTHCGVVAVYSEQPEIDILHKSRLVKELETSIPLVRAIVERQEGDMDTQLVRQLSSLFFRLFTYAEDEEVRYAAWQLHELLDSAHKPEKEPETRKTLTGQLLHEACCSVVGSTEEWSTVKHGTQIAYNNVAYILCEEMRLCCSCGKQQEPEHMHEAAGMVFCSACILRLRDAGVL